MGKSANIAKRGLNWSCFRSGTQQVKVETAESQEEEPHVADKEYRMPLDAALANTGSGWQAIFRQLLQQEDDELASVVTGCNRQQAPQKNPAQDDSRAFLEQGDASGLSASTVDGASGGQLSASVRDSEIQDRLSKTQPLPVAHRRSFEERCAQQLLSRQSTLDNSIQQPQFCCSRGSRVSMDEGRGQPSSTRKKPEGLQPRKSFALFRQGSSISVRGSSELDEADRNSVPLSASKEQEVLDLISKIRLRGTKDEIIRAETLWQDRPALLLLLRRPGCVTCRAESLKLEQIADRLDALGVRRVAIVHEWFEAEIAAYMKDFWSGEVYLDPGREFYRVLGGGEIKQGKMIDFIKPNSKLWKNIAVARVIMHGQPSNFKGDFMTLGGLLVVRSGSSGVEYMFREEVFGDPLRIKLILDECTAAANYVVPESTAEADSQRAIQPPARNMSRQINSSFDGRKSSLGTGDAESAVKVAQSLSGRGGEVNAPTATDIQDAAQPANLPVRGVANLSLQQLSGQDRRRRGTTPSFDWSHPVLRASLEIAARASSDETSRASFERPGIRTSSARSSIEREREVKMRAVTGDEDSKFAIAQSSSFYTSTGTTK